MRTGFIFSFFLGSLGNTSVRVGCTEMVASGVPCGYTRNQPCKMLTGPDYEVGEELIANFAKSSDYHHSYGECTSGECRAYHTWSWFRVIDNTLDLSKYQVEIDADGLRSFGYICYDLVDDQWNHFIQKYTTDNPEQYGYREEFACEQTAYHGDGKVLDCNNHPILGPTDGWPSNSDDKLFLHRPYEDPFLTYGPALGALGDSLCGTTDYCELYTRDIWAMGDHLVGNIVTPTRTNAACFDDVCPGFGFQRYFVVVDNLKTTGGGPNWREVHPKLNYGGLCPHFCQDADGNVVEICVESPAVCRYGEYLGYVLDINFNFLLDLHNGGIPGPTTTTTTSTTTQTSTTTSTTTQTSTTTSTTTQTSTTTSTTTQTSTTTSTTTQTSTTTSTTTQTSTTTSTTTLTSTTTSTTTRTSTTTTSTNDPTTTAAAIVRETTPYFPHEMEVHLEDCSIIDYEEGCGIANLPCKVHTPSSYRVGDVLRLEYRQDATEWNICMGDSCEAYVKSIIVIVEENNMPDNKVWISGDAFVAFCLSSCGIEVVDEFHFSGVCQVFPEDCTYGISMTNLRCPSGRSKLFPIQFPDATENLDATKNFQGNIQTDSAAQELLPLLLVPIGVLFT